MLIPLRSKPILRVLLGSGFSVSVRTFSEVVTQRVLGTAYIVHSDYLATLVECGVLGLLAYLFLLFAIGRTLLTYRRSIFSNLRHRAS